MFKKIAKLISLWKDIHSGLSGQPLLWFAAQMFKSKAQFEQKNDISTKFLSNVITK